MSDDVRASLEEAFAAQTSGKSAADTPAPTTSDDVVDTPKVETADPVDKKPEASADTPADKAPKDGTPPADKPKTTRLAAPVKWTKEDKDAWDEADKLTEGLPEEQAAAVRKIQGILVGRNRSMEAAFTQQFQGMAATRKAYEEIDAVLKPHRTEWTAAGISDATGLKQLLDGFKFSKDNPAEFIKWMAGIRNVDLHKLVGAPAARPGDDEQIELHPVLQRQFAELRAENQRLQQQLGQFGQTVQQRQQQEQRALQANVQSEITAFTSEVDEAGQPRYPFFNEVRGDMKLLIDGGRANTLKEAYDMAVHANPATRQRLMESLEVERRREWERKQREDAKRARQAGGSLAPGGPVVTRDAPAEAAADGSVRAALEAALMARQSASNQRV
jgi:hypothetical protein